MTKSNSQGLANIPLILGILLLVFAVPVAVLLVQQNQNTQNRAYEVSSTGSVDCTQILASKINYCTGSITANTSGVPCSEIESAITKYCTDVISPAPTVTPQCSSGQTKCAGRILFNCVNNSWTLKQICTLKCQNGKCLDKPQIIIDPPTNPAY